ncbi:hypothetical protein ALC56_05563, partial [Trachymyrmex septentrionalis]
IHSNTANLTESELSMMISMKNNVSPSIIQALVVFLLKLRKTYKLQMIASILQLEQSVSDYSASIMKFFLDRGFRDIADDLEIKYRLLDHKIDNKLVQHYAHKCANGRRTVAVHIAIICYLSYSRYLSKIFELVEILSNIFQKDNSVPIIESNSKDD